MHYQFYKNAPVEKVDNDDVDDHDSRGVVDDDHDGSCGGVDDYDGNGSGIDDHDGSCGGTDEKL